MNRYCFIDSGSIIKQTKINISRNRYKLVIDFSNAYLSESISSNFNIVQAQDCYNNLEIRELWKLWRQNNCLDTILKNKLQANDFIDYTDTTTVYYVWPGTKSGNKWSLNGLEISSEIKNEHSS